MTHLAVLPKPLAGAPLQFALLAPVFVVFLIFFVGTPIVCGGKAVDLPYLPNAGLIPDADNDLAISVQRDGMIFIGARWYPATAFSEKLLELRQWAPNRHILLRADRSLHFGQVRSVLSALRAAGFTEVALITFDGTPATVMARSAA